MLLFRNAVVSQFTGVNKAQRVSNFHSEGSGRERGGREEGEGGAVTHFTLVLFPAAPFHVPLLLMNLIVWFQNASLKASLPFPSVLRLRLADLQINL